MRPALTVLAAGTIAAAALLAPSAASADTHVAWPPAPHRAQSRVVDPTNDITWTVADHKVAVLNPDLVSLPLQYTCGTAASPENRQYVPGVFQATLMDATAGAFEPTDGNTPAAGVTFTCDGVQHLINTPLGRQSGQPGGPSTDRGFERGNVEVGLYEATSLEGGQATFEHDIVGDAPADQRAPVTVTVNATPESTRPGKKITVKGTVKRNGHAYKDKFAILYFQDTDAGEPAQRVGDDHASSKGNLETKVKVTGPGTYFWVTRSTSKTQAGATLGDYAAAGTNRTH